MKAISTRGCVHECLHSVVHYSCKLEITYVSVIGKWINRTMFMQWNRYGLQHRWISKPLCSEEQHLQGKETTVSIQPYEVQAGENPWHKKSGQCLCLEGVRGIGKRHEGISNFLYLNMALVGSVRTHGIIFA